MGAHTGSVGEAGYQRIWTEFRTRPSPHVITNLETIPNRIPTDLNRSLPLSGRVTEARRGEEKLAQLDFKKITTFESNYHAAPRWVDQYGMCLSRVNAANLRIQKWRVIIWKHHSLPILPPPRIHGRPVDSRQIGPSSRLRRIRSIQILLKNLLLQLVSFSKNHLINFIPHISSARNNHDRFLGQIHHIWSPSSIVSQPRRF